MAKSKRRMFYTFLLFIFQMIFNAIISIAQKRSFRYHGCIPLLRKSTRSENNDIIVLHIEHGHKRKTSIRFF